MPIYLDEEAVDLSAEDLGSLLAAATDHLRPLGRIVVEVTIDGEPVLGDQLQSRAREAIGDVEVRMVSADPSALATDALGQIRERLTAAEQAQAQAAELLQQDQTEQAMKQIAESIDAWQRTPMGIVNAARIVGLDHQSIEVDGQKFEALANELVERLRGLRDLLQSGDTVALADALAYEWPTTTDRWRGLVDAVLDKVS